MRLRLTDIQLFIAMRQPLLFELHFFYIHIEYYRLEYIGIVYFDIVYVCVAYFPFGNTGGGDGEEQASGRTILNELCRRGGGIRPYFGAGCGVEQFAINFDSVSCIFCSVKSKLG